MSRKRLLFALVAALLAFVPASYAGFINGDFEMGDWTGWTRDGGLWYGGYGTYTYTGDQGKSAIVSAGWDPILLARGVQVPMVYAGNYSGRVNNSDNMYHFSTIVQDVLNWQDPDIYFAWSAVLESPSGHQDTQPHFWLRLFDVTTSTMLYEQLIHAANTPPGLFTLVGGWQYSDWQTVHIDTSSVIGDDLRLTLLGSDCGLSGHGGYVYLDGFGNVEPQQVPEPCTMLVCLGGFGMLLRRRRQR